VPQQLDSLSTHEAICEEAEWQAGPQAWFLAFVVVTECQDKATVPMSNNYRVNRIVQEGK